MCLTSRMCPGVKYLLLGCRYWGLGCYFLAYGSFDLCLVSWAILSNNVVGMSFVLMLRVISPVHPGWFLSTKALTRMHRAFMLGLGNRIMRVQRTICTLLLLHLQISPNISQVISATCGARVVCPRPHVR